MPKHTRNARPVLTSQSPRLRNRLVGSHGGTFAEQVICPGCEYEVGVRPNGTIASHRVGWSRDNSFICPWSGADRP